MALTRKFLKALEIDGDKADQIIEAHTETIDGLRTSLDAAQADANKLPEIQKQLEAAQAELEAAKKDSYKVKYEAIKEDFETYKAEQAKKESRSAKETAYRALLKQAGVSDKRIESVLKVSDVDGVELNEKGEIADAKDRLKSIKDEWADFIETTEVKGAVTPNPPVNAGNVGGPTMTVEEIDKIKDTRARQAAMAKNLELYGIK